jgi:hypothetical protein
MLSEPDLLVFAELAGDGKSLEARFRAFATAFEWVLGIAEENELRICVADEFLAALSDRFPLRKMRVTVGAGVAADAFPQYALTRLGRVFYRIEYQGCEEALQCDPELRRVGVALVDEDVWLGWRETVAQYAAIIVAGGRAGLAFGVEEAASTFTGTSVKLAAGEGVATNCRILRAGEPCEQVGLLDPRTVSRIRQRMEGCDPEIVFEKTGHVPAKEIEAFLMRVARDSGVVRRCGTTWHDRELGERCKVELRPANGELGFRVSNGRETVKGVFHIVAETEVEQQSAFVLVRRAMRGRCDGRFTM